MDKINTALGGGVGRRRVKLFLEKGGVLRVGSIYARILCSIVNATTGIPTQYLNNPRNPFFKRDSLSFL